MIEDTVFKEGIIFLVMNDTQYPVYRSKNIEVDTSEAKVDWGFTEHNWLWEIEGSKGNATS